jgi:hypothetical protein
VNIPDRGSASVAALVVPPARGHPSAIAAAVAVAGVPDPPPSVGEASVATAAVRNRALYAPACWAAAGDVMISMPPAVVVTAPAVVAASCARAVLAVVASVLVGQAGLFCWTVARAVAAARVAGAVAVSGAAAAAGGGARRGWWCLVVQMVVERCLWCQAARGPRLAWPPWMWKGGWRAVMVRP